jgi:hypothetical protein
MELINLTPHAIVLNDGRSVGASGSVARVSSSFTKFDEAGICEQTFGDIQGLPEPKEDTLYVVSALVLAAAKASGRTDVIAPATGHPEVRRNEAGQIISVPGFVR